MLWGPGQRQYHSAVVGYTDGTHTHIEPTIPADNIFGDGGRYRPNQWTGTLGKPGELVYDLSNPSGVNDDPRIKCQGWALKQPHANEWASGLPTCPCTKMQALGDMSFIQEVLDQTDRVAALRAQRYGGVGRHVFRSVLSNAYGSGKRCVYELEGDLLTGYSERYFTVADRQRHIDEDLLPFQWCCIDSPLCDLYLKQRPLDRCQGYCWSNPSNCSTSKKAGQGVATVFGSLHFITFDGTEYSFKALGEFVIVRLSSPSGSNIFTLQGQHDRLHSNSNQVHSQVPAVVRMAAFYQGIGKVEWRCAETGDGLELIVDDDNIPVSVGVVYVGRRDFAVRCLSESHCVAVYSGGLHVSVKRVPGYRELGAEVEVPQKFFNRTVGLMGLWCSNRSAEFLMSDGILLVPPSLSPLLQDKINAFGMSWAVPVPESLLLSRPPEPFFPFSNEDLLQSASPARVNELMTFCSGNMQCVYDSLATGDMNVGEAARKAKESYTSTVLLYGNMPPIVTEPLEILATVNSTVKVQLLARDSNGDAISVSLLYPRPLRVSLAGDGVLSWTPLSTSPVQIQLKISDSTSSTLFVPTIKLCNCVNGGTCQFNTPSQSQLLGKFQLVSCLCHKGFGGQFCEKRTNVCNGLPCYPGVTCAPLDQPGEFSCGPCPEKTIANGKEGYKCFEQDFCEAPYPFPCHKDATCKSLKSNYTCTCKPGYTGDGKTCTDINECVDLKTCPNAKYECKNTPGSVECVCRYKDSNHNDGCGDSANPPGSNVFKVSVGWQQNSGLTQLENLWSTGFKNKFYNASEVNPSEYRVNVSSDTPHWYIQDYMSRASSEYKIQSVNVEDLDECANDIAVCKEPAVCKNTYGGYRCICHGEADVEENQECIVMDSAHLTERQVCRSSWSERVKKGPLTQT
ncbi:mucin-like protein [Periophthalmus magnuspinnatus]|uniref:mucin-like protein n=1 Tax=Periophthalmus magnuspinnatus TaxID=409849 RepID=UPI0024363418|nr:mucin-like protein [Periophthalmus magnuspinnatus]